MRLIEAIRGFGCDSCIAATLLRRRAPAAQPVKLLLS